MIARQITRLIRREGAKLSDYHSSAAAILISILNDEGARAAGLEPNTEAAEFAVPDKHVTSTRIGRQTIDNALRDLGHSITPN